MERFIKLGIVMSFMGVTAILIAGTITNNKPMITGGTIAIIAIGLIAVGVVFATRTQKRVTFSDNITISNPLISNI
jgi:NO-binding membrane sensor protein with MHYT domain